MFAIPGGGFLFGAILGMLIVAPGVAALEVPFWNVLLVVILPLFLNFVFVPNRRFALSNLLVPVVIAEALLGGRGNWLSVGFLAGRYILFLSVLAAWIIDALTLRSALHGKKIIGYILVVGFVAPLFWLFWSINHGAAPVDAFSDLNFLFVLLLYFPLSLWLRVGPPISWVREYIAGLLTVLGIVFSVAPILYWLINWDLGVQTWFTGNVTYFPNGFPRYSFSVDVYFPMSIWLGLVMLVRWRVGQSEKLSPEKSVLLLSVSVLAMAMTFGRALWLSFVIASFAALAVGMLWLITRRGFRRLALVLLIVMGIGAGLMIMFAPEGVARFLVLNDRANLIRLEQSAVLMSGWHQAPLVGNGFGITLPSGYVRNKEEPYLFELQYHSLLFKSGVIGLMLVLTIPLMAFRGIKFAVRRMVRSLSVSSGYALLVSASVGVITIAVAGAFNPYLTSFHFGFLATLTLALYAYLKMEMENLPPCLTRTSV